MPRSLEGAPAGGTAAYGPAEIYVTGGIAVAIVPDKTSMTIRRRA